MSYVDGIVDQPFDTAESQDEAAAQHQMALDVLYRGLSVRRQGR